MTILIGMMAMVLTVSIARAGKTEVAVGAKLYLRTTMFYSSYGSSLDISWIYMGADGVVVYNPKHGVNPINYQAEVADNAGNAGHYKIAGDMINVTWSNGKTASWKMEYDKSGVVSAIDGGIVTLQPPLPAGYRLSGRYAASAVMPNVSAVNTMIFKKDGTFTSERSGAVSTTNTSGYADNTYAGTYTINGNTLTLTFNSGKKETAVLTVWKMDGNKLRLIINSSSFPQEG